MKKDKLKEQLIQKIINSTGRAKIALIQIFKNKYPNDKVP